MRMASTAIALSFFVACSGGGGHPRRAAPTSSTTSSTAAATTSTTPPSTTRLGPQTCATARLAISAGESQGAAGHSFLPLLFRNSSPTKCRLSGYPGVAGLDDTGRQVAQARRTPRGAAGGLPPEDKTPPIIELAPGETASALVEGTNVPEGTATSCPQFVALLVTPPNETHSVKVAASLLGCSGLEVHPVVPGTTGLIN